MLEGFLGSAGCPAQERKENGDAAELEVHTTAGSGAPPPSTDVVFTAQGEMPWRGPA